MFHFLFHPIEVVSAFKKLFLWFTDRQHFKLHESKSDNISIYSYTVLLPYIITYQIDLIIFNEFLCDTNLFSVKLHNTWKFHNISRHCMNAVIIITYCTYLSHIMCTLNVNKPSIIIYAIICNNYCA